MRKSCWEWKCTRSMEMHKKSWVLFGVAAGLVTAVGFAWFKPQADHTAHQMAQRASDGAAIKLPQLTETAQAGETVFNDNCSACHGKHAAGTDQGPPLIHIIYEPSHHGDPSFYRAVAQGVRRHHWRFGDMPPIEGVSEADVGKIIAYVRETQRANGIN